MTSRIVQWGTGNVGKHALRAIVERPDLELVGLRVYNPDKVGKDAGELLDQEPIGVLATDDIEQILPIDARLRLLHRARLDPQRRRGSARRHLPSPGVGQERRVERGGVPRVLPTRVRAPGRGRDARTARIRRACEDGRHLVLPRRYQPGFRYGSLADPFVAAQSAHRPHYGDRGGRHVGLSVDPHGARCHRLRTGARGGDGARRPQPRSVPGCVLPLHADARRRDRRRDRRGDVPPRGRGHRCAAGDRRRHDRRRHRRRHEDGVRRSRPRPTRDQPRARLAREPTTWAATGPRAGAAGSCTSTAIRRSTPRSRCRRAPTPGARPRCRSRRCS